MASTDMSVSPRLPPELWLQIFHYATTSRWASAHEYQPFQALFASGDVCDATLKIKHAIVCVCKQWRALGAEMFYADIRVGRGLPALTRCLENSHAGIPKHWVRRVVLPYSQSSTPTWHPIPALHILTLTQHLEVLVRPPLPLGRTGRLQFEFSTTTPTFPRLKRIDWWQHNQASCTDGINSLDDVLRHAPNVEYLSLSGDFWMTSLRQQRLRLPSVTTIHLHNLNAMFVRQVCMWTLPALTHLIVDSLLPPMAACEALWEKYGAQLRVVELGTSSAAVGGDQLADVLASCPSLTDLNYPVLATCLPRPPAEHDALKRVGLFAQISAGCDEVVDGDEVWRHVEEHLSGYRKDDFPSLTHFILYGPDWPRILRDPRFISLEENVRASGRCIVLDAEVRYDGTMMLQAGRD